MPSFSKLAVAAATLALAVAAPAKSGFTIEQVPNPNYTGPNGRGAMLKALEKYGAHERASAVRAASAATSSSSSGGGTGSSGSVPAVPAQYDSEYLCEVKVGATSPVTMKLDFDTGSSDLWVFSSLMPTSEQGKHTLYKPTAADKVSGSSWKISYGDGSGASGVVYKDTVNIGGVSVTSQGVEAATSASSEFVSGVGDGLVGLAFDSINAATPKQETFFDNAVSQGLPEKLFAADLKYHATGSYDFGFLDSSKYTGDITYTTVSDAEGFWMFTPTGYAVGSGAISTSTSLKGIADTGTTLIMAPAAVVSAYYKQVTGASNSAADGGYVFPCTATLPSFTLEIGSYKAVVPGKYLNYSPVTTGSSTCYGGIQSDASIGFAIWGDVFLKSQYVVFDQTQSTPRLGFAAQAS